VLQERQQTLRALVDWSYELLEPAEQTVLARLAAFVGGFDLAAAETVCGDATLDSADVLDLLASLCEKSLVMLEERDEGSRYRMLETIRDYAREKLEQGGDAAAVTARHCEHYFAVAKAANHGLRGPQQADWIWKLEVELDNVRNAIALALAGGVDSFIAVKFAVAMQGFWILRGYSTEGRKLVRAALALPAIEASSVAQGWALYVGAALAESQSDHAEARKMLETCLELRRQLGNEIDIAATLSTLSLARLQAGDTVGAAAGETEALQIFQRLGDRRGEAIGLLHLGQISLFEGDDGAARTHLDQCLAIAREIKHQELEAECELFLGATALQGDDRAQAGLRFKRSLTVCREAGDKRGEAHALWWLGHLDLRSGDIVSARTRLSEALRAFRAFEAWEDVLGCLEDHAVLALAEGLPDVSVGLAAVATKARERLGLVHSPRDEARWQAHLAEMRLAVPDLQYSGVWLDAQEWQNAVAFRHALAPQKETATA
jgi:non-specific serine/threonine protein kinase